MPSKRRKITITTDEYLYRKLKVGAGILSMSLSQFCRFLLENGYDIVPLSVVGKKWDYINKSYEDEVVIPDPKPRLLL